MKLLLSVALLAPLTLSAQGIHFESGLSWGQVKGKAKTENKYIFVDCYASWCGPCKKMDQDVYPKDSVGAVVNPRFVCVKVQLDTSKNDNDEVKAWYADAHALMIAYKIGAFPAYLFFSPAGELVHRGLGYQQPKDFVQLAVEATDPHQQYYVLMAAYRSSARDYSTMPALANKAKSFNDKALADSIAADYLHNYLNKLSDAAICTKPNLEFVAAFAKVLTSKDKVFTCIFEHPALADTAMHDNSLAKRFVNYMVTKEEITPVTARAKKEGKEPDWEKIGRNIQYKFGQEYVGENIIRSKVGWCRDLKDWKNYTKYLVKLMDLQKIRRMPTSAMDILTLNNSAWEVFQYSDNKEELQKAVLWSEEAIAMEPKPTGTMLDTKANLLYKLGRKNEAIALEAMALELSPNAKGIKDALEKMQHGKPTWAMAHQ